MTTTTTDTQLMTLPRDLFELYGFEFRLMLSKKLPYLSTVYLDSVETTGGEEQISYLHLPIFLPTSLDIGRSN